MRFRVMSVSLAALSHAIQVFNTDMHPLHTRTLATYGPLGSAQTHTRPFLPHGPLLRWEQV